MYNFLALLFGEKFWWLNSLVIKLVLSIRGVKVGSNFVIHGIPHLKIKGNASDITIGNNVFIGGNIDLRNRERGRIIIEDNVAIDDNCRLLAANDATLKIGYGASIGRDCIFNCGAGVSIGGKTLLASAVYINSSDHNISKSKFIKDQGYMHEPIVIEEDVFIGGHVSIKKGVIIGKGAVVGANAVVTKNLPEYSINVGIPATTIKYRE
jgi:acetyltransferase-like isoleucine patch superfamily enzyme